MASRSSIKEDPLGIGSYEPLKTSELPLRLNVLRHFLYLRTFKFPSGTSLTKIYNQVYDDLIKIYTSTSIPVTKNKKTIIDQIKSMESKRKNINKKKTPAQIQKFGNFLKQIFPVVKSIIDVPMKERGFYLDQCEERKMMIASSIDKKQTIRNKRILGNKLRLQQAELQSTQSHSSGQQSLPASLRLSDTSVTSCSSSDTDGCSQCSTYKTQQSHSASSAKKYFNSKLHNTADAAAQIGIGDEKAAKLLTAFSQDVGLKTVITQKKLRSQREIIRNERLQSLQDNVVYGKYYTTCTHIILMQH